MGGKSKHHYVRLFVFTIFMCLFAFSLFAQATSQNTMTLYGQLFDTTSYPALGAHTITVTIYDASTSGNALFTEEHNVTVLDDGTYTVIIGDGFMPGSSVATNGIPASVFTNDNWYMGIKVDTDDEMTPRIRITSAPYAISAGQLGGLDASDYVTKTELTGEGFLKTETDPVYSAAPAASITDAGSGLVTTGTERTNWNTAYGWGNHASAGYLTTGDNLGNHTATTSLNMNSYYIYNNGSGYGGDVAFSDDAVPRINGNYNLGTSSYQWGRLYVGGIYLNGDLRTSWPGGVGGNGVVGRLALWDGYSSLTSNSGITYNGSNIACGTAATTTYRMFGYYDANNYGTVGSSSTGVYGKGSQFGVYGSSSTYGVYGSGTAYGVYGQATSYGVYGNASQYGVYGRSSNYAGFFLGNVRVSGTLSKAAGSFLIDHPLDPENKTLRHNFVESPENLCMYRGTVVIGKNGEAIVAMPEYFKALTKENEATVTLTTIGKPFAVGYEWNADFTQFTVYGDANRKLSYIVLADRDDPVMKQLYKPVEEEKGDGNFEKGLLLYPEAFGYPEEKGYDYQIDKRIMSKTNITMPDDDKIAE